MITCSIYSLLRKIRIQIAMISNTEKKIPNGPIVLPMSGLIPWGEARMYSLISGDMNTSCATDFTKNTPTKRMNPIKYLDLIF